MKRNSNPNPSRKPEPRLNKRSRGVALIAVLWLSLLLAVIAGSLIVTTRTELRLSRNLLESARAEALADGGVYLAIWHLLPGGPAIRWRADGTVHVVELESGRLEIAVEEAAGRIDLNAAPPGLIAGLFRAAGVEPGEAAILAARIADWRDGDEDTRPGGAEQADYDAAGLAARVGNAPFLTPGEILRVPGIDMVLYARIEDAVTVWSRRRGIDPAAAQRLAPLALPGLDEATADPLLPTRARAWLIRGGERVLHVTVRAETKEGGVFRREAVIEPRPGADPPFIVHAWRPGIVAE